LYLAHRDTRAPWYAKAFTTLVVGYAFSPIDLIPDFVPVLSYLDDLILLPIGVIVALQLIPTGIMVECQAKARYQNIAGTLAIYLVGVMIVLFWIALFSLAAIYLGKRVILIRCE
jgi:uncharacterized membrane protein YkvA (DUF1232 family)